MSNMRIDMLGNVRWYNNREQLHRIDGPAIELGNGWRCWFLNGKQHREDGPAVEYRKTKEWWVRGERVE